MITIGMSAFNSASTIGRAIESILAQTYCEWALNIIDANSSDDTLEICRSYALQDTRITIVELDLQRPWHLNAKEHILMASSKYFMILDADDYLGVNWLSELSASMAKSDSIAAFGTYCMVDTNGVLFDRNLSNGRSFKFASRKNRFWRVASYIMAPESLGKVNLVYSLWRTEVLRDLTVSKEIFSESKPWNTNFDQIFVLECLDFGAILSVPTTKIFRAAKLEIDEPMNQSRMVQNRDIFKKLRRFVLVTLQVFLKRPPFSLTIKWMREDIRRFYYFPFLLLRVLLSIFSPLLEKILSLQRELRNN